MELESDMLKICPSCASMESAISCRICKSNGGQDLVTSPCRCKGSMGAVHVSCLQEWLAESARESCELCETPFNVVKTRKYGFLNSIRVFLRDKVNHVRLSRDVFFLTVSTINTAILFCAWFTFVSKELAGILKGAKYFGAGEMLKGLTYCFLFTFALAFVSANTVDDGCRAYYRYCRRWYDWWQADVDLKLILDHDNAAEKIKPKDE